MKTSTKMCIWLFDGLVTLIFTFNAGNAVAMECYECHGSKNPQDYRPVDSPNRNILTGGFQGNHRTHMDPIASASSCEKCHHGAAQYGQGHRNTQIDISPNINNSPLTATYRNGSTAFPQRTTPRLGSCSNVNCHFESATQIWGGSPSSTTCTTCHAAPPSGGSGGSAGSHTKHDQYFPGIANCQKCHANNTTFQHATSAGNRDLNISFVAAPNNGSGAYSGPLNDYLPSQINVFGSCTATYCHSPGTKSTSPFTAPNQTATWGRTLGCDGCHKSTPTSGSHASHLASTYGVPVPCYKCHAATVTAGMAISPTINHVNRLVNVAFDSTTTAVFGKYSGHLTPMQKNPGSGYANCENVYCHSNGQGAGGSWPPTYSAPKWGVYESGNCGTCHDHGYHSGGAKIISGSHDKHMNYGFTRGATGCGICHYGDGVTDSGCTQCHFWSDALTTSHVNHKVDVSFVSKFGGTYNGTPEPGDGYSTCTNTYCHSNGTSVATAAISPNVTTNWGSGAIDCSSCHDYPPSYATGTPKANSHTIHTTGKGITCSRCHYATTSDNITISSTVKHVNKSYDISAPPGETLAYTFTPRGGSCSTYCHSSAQGVNDPTQPPVYANPVWGNYTTQGIGCAKCHGARTHMQAITTGSHGKHLMFEQGSFCIQCHATNQFANARFGSCDECHLGRLSTKVRSNDPEHANGVINVAFDKRTPLAGANATYLGDSVPGTPYGGCSSVYCHSQGTSFIEPFPAPNILNPVWGSTLPGDCSGCHGSDRQSAVQLSTGSHQKHIRYCCAFCHSSSVSDSRTPIPTNGGTYSRHVNGYVDVSLQHGGTYAGQASVSRRAGSAPGSCKSGICHNNGTWITTGAIFGITSSPVWGSPGAFTCSSCHDYPPAYQDNSIKPNSHASHSVYSCNVCHFPTTPDGVSISANEAHLNQQFDLGSDGSATFTYSFNTRGSTCSNVSCHTSEPKNTNWGNFAQEPVSLSPANNSSNVPTTAVPSVVFSEDMDPASINITTFQLDNGTNGTVSYDPATRTATYVPDTSLPYYNIYTATVGTGVKNINGKPLPHSYSWSFTTAKSALFQAVMTELFDSSNPPGWTLYHASGNNDWTYWIGYQSNETGTYGPSLYVTAQNQNVTPILDGEMRSPVLNLSGYQSVELTFKTSFAAYGYPITADVDVSTNGVAGPWTNVWKRTETYRFYKNETVNISKQAKGKANVMLRFRFQNPLGYTIPFWQVDDVMVSGDPQ